MSSDPSMVPYFAATSLIGGTIGYWYGRPYSPKGLSLHYSLEAKITYTCIGAVLVALWPITLTCAGFGGIAYLICSGLAGNFGGL
jgi:hypothetical protein